MDELLRTANEGRMLRRGIRAAIIGRPNVGKSSLLNQLLGHDRAIVSPIPGTTRDTIEETANVRGMPVVFIDTAGLREASDEIEIEGVRRSRGALAAAELVLHVLDGAEAAERRRTKSCWAEFAGKKRLLVRNKADLPTRLELPAGTAARSDVSCLTGAGIEESKDAIKEKVWAGGIQAEMLQVMINSRHRGRVAAGARGGGAGGGGVAGRPGAGTGGAGPAHGRQRRRRNRGQNDDGRFAGLHLQPVLSGQVGETGQGVNR